MEILLCKGGFNGDPYVKKILTYVKKILMEILCKENFDGDPYVRDLDGDPYVNEIFMEIVISRRF